MFKDLQHNPDQLLGLDIATVFMNMPMTIDIRIAKGNELITADYVPNRLTIVINDKDIITSAGWY